MDKYAQLRAALDEATPGPWKAHEHGVGEFIVYRDGSVIDQPAIVFVDYDIRYATGDMEQQEKDVAYIAAAHPEAIRALLADKDGLEVATKEAAEVIISRNDEIRRLREALRWAVGTLQSACSLTGPVNESSPFMLGDETRTVAQICDAADAALAQEQS